MTISLPLPDKRLSPNGRIHWQKRRSLVKTCRELAKLKVLCRIGINRPPEISGYSLAFFYPDARKRDDDNTEGSFGIKAYRDGIADALMMDDHWLKKLS